MIDELTVIPKPQNNNARNITLATLALAFVIFICSNYLPRYVGILQLTGVCFLITSILIYVRYVSAVYVYEITKDYDSTPIFVVSSRTGKRQTTLCRIALWDVEKIDKERKTDTRAHVTNRQTTYLYRYLPTIGADVVYRICAKSDRHKAEILIEGTDDFISVLNGAVAEAKTQKPVDDE